MIGVVHILNQFFAGIGGEDKANIAVVAVEGAAGAARGLQVELREQGQGRSDSVFWRQLFSRT